MSVSVLLRGLQAQPLAAYLGALGVLRISASHTVTPVRGAFTEQGFLLEGISRASLQALLLEHWRPSPILTPWNNASGFYESSKGRLAAAAITELVESADPRFALLRTAVLQVRDVVARARYAEAPGDDEKARFIARLRNVLSDEAISWLDAVAVVESDDARMMPLLGSGGNEGVLDYSGLYLRSVVETLLRDRSRSDRLLAAALDGTTVGDLVEGPGGQFDPGVAGGFNTGPGFESKDLPKNPWSFLLLLEGSLLWASALASRQQGSASEYRFAVSPFTVRHRAAGYGSAGRSDNDPQRVRAEVWVPIWQKPAGLLEVTRFIGEGRVDVTGRGGTARAGDSLDFVDALSSLGVDRGVSSFVRYALIKRRGDAYIALPAGRVPVRYRREVDLVRQLDSQMDVVDRFFARFPGEEGAPAPLKGLRRRIDDARYLVSTRGGPDAMVALVRAIGALEMTLARRDPGKEPQLHRPLGGLGTEWIDACGDSVEVRLAAAFASIGATEGVAPLRAYLAPLDPARPGQFAPAARPRIWAGMSLDDRLAAVLQRRLLDGARASGHGPAGRTPTWGTRLAHLDDVACFLTGDLVDGQLLEELIFGFTWIRQAGGTTKQDGRGRAPALSRSYSLLKLLFLPGGIQVGTDAVHVPPDASIVPLLRAGRINDAIESASRQLRAKGLRPRRIAAHEPDDPGRGRRLAAALLLPVHPASRLQREALIRSDDPDSPTQESPDVR